MSGAYVHGYHARENERLEDRTFSAMIEGAREGAIAAGLIEPGRFDAGIRDLYRTSEQDGVFCYTFLKAVASR